MIFWWIGVALALPIQRVEPDGLSVGVDVEYSWLPRDSTVQVVQGVCQDTHTRVQVLVVDPWYRVPKVSLAPVGAEYCVPTRMLKKVSTPPGDPRAELRVRMAWESRFGPIDDQAMKSTAWGRVALPMVRELSQEERSVEQQREGLRTPKQRQKATDAVGAEDQDGPIYLHFLGADLSRSDRWGTPETVLSLIELFYGWRTHCKALSIPHATPGNCTVQVGDLGWYNNTQPDPLGHKSDHARCADIRLFRNDGSRYEAWFNRPDDREGREGGYSQSLTQAFLEYAISAHRPTVVHFNDPAVIAAVPGVTASSGHDDHIHICF
jgi:hypothetical protein